MSNILMMIFTSSDDNNLSESYLFWYSWSWQVPHSGWPVSAKSWHPLMYNQPPSVLESLGVYRLCAAFRCDMLDGPPWWCLSTRTVRCLPHQTAWPPGHPPVPLTRPSHWYTGTNVSALGVLGLTAEVCLYKSLNSDKTLFGTYSGSADALTF